MDSRFIVGQPLVPNRQGQFWTYLTGKARTLFWWNIGAGILQVLSAIAIAIAYAVITAEDDAVTRPGQLYVDTLQSDFTVQNKEWRRYELFWVLIWMPVITAVFHFWQAILLFNVSDRSQFPTKAFSVPPRNLVWTSFFNSDAFLVSIGNGINAVRWVEYSITASLMTWILFQSSGVTNIFLVLLGGVVCNVAMQLCGLEHERLRSSMYDAEAIKEREAQGGVPFYKRWTLPFSIGSIIFVGVWSIIFCYFFRTVNASDDEVPTTVRVIVIGLFFGFLTFAVNAILFPCKAIKFETFDALDVIYTLLSGINKTFLDWTFFIAIVGSV